MNGGPTICHLTAVRRFLLSPSCNSWNLHAATQWNSFLLPLDCFCCCQFTFCGLVSKCVLPHLVLCCAGTDERKQSAGFVGVFQCHCESDSSIIVQHVFFFSWLIHHILHDPGLDTVTTHTHTQKLLPLCCDLRTHTCAHTHHNPV